MTDTDDPPANKSELLAFMQRHWDGFVNASDAVPDDVWLGPVDAAGWTIRDHVDHVVAWVTAEVALLGAGVPITESAGMPVEVWESENPDVGNEWLRQTRSPASPAALRAERDRIFPRLLDVVSGMSDAELAQPARISGLESSDRPLLLVISEYCGLHYDDHREQIVLLGETGV